MFMVSEIKKWAISKGYQVKNCKEGGYTWIHLETKESFHSKDLDSLATDIFNHLTKGVWKDYQENYKKQKEQKEKK